MLLISGSLITSGGGFSSYYLQPDYQATAVSSYFNQFNESNGPKFSENFPYSTQFRGYPDVSLASVNYLMLVNSKYYIASDTAVGSTIFASMISLMNSYLLQQGRPALGWINPLLYEYSTYFTNDITSGQNNCNSHFCCDIGKFNIVCY